MVSDFAHPVDFTIHPKATGYNYLNWIISGSWQGSIGITSEPDGNPLLLTGNIRDREISVNQSGRFRHIVTEFTALGLYQLTGVAGESLVDLAVSCDDLDSEFTNDCQRFIRTSRALGQTAPIDVYMDAFTEFLVCRAQQAKPVPDYLSYAVEHLEKVDGIAKIADIYTSLGVTRRQLDRSFKELVGITPKAFARVIQMNTMLEKLLSAKHERLCDTACDLGYYDESHMIRTLKEFFDITPSKLSSHRYQTELNFVGSSRGISTKAD